MVFGKLKLISDSGLVTFWLSCEKEFDTCWGTDFLGDDVAFGKLKLISDSGLVTFWLSCEKEFDTSNMVVSKILVDILGTPH